MTESLSEAFNKNYEGGRAGFSSPGDRPESVEDVAKLPPRWRKAWLLEELAGVETSIWSKTRAKLNNSDLDSLLDGLMQEMNVRPGLVEVKDSK